MDINSNKKFDSIQEDASYMESQSTILGTQSNSVREDNSVNESESTTESTNKTDSFENKSSKFINQFDLCSNSYPCTSHKADTDQALENASDNSISSNTTILGSEYNQLNLKSHDNSITSEETKPKLVDDISNFQNSYTFSSNSYLSKVDTKPTIIQPSEESSNKQLNNITDCWTDPRKCYYITDDILGETKSLNVAKKKSKPKEKHYYMSNKINTNNEVQTKKKVYERHKQTDNQESEVKYIGHKNKKNSNIYKIFLKTQRIHTRINNFTYGKHKTNKDSSIKYIFKFYKQILKTSHDNSSRLYTSFTSKKSEQALFASDGGGKSAVVFIDGNSRHYSTPKIVADLTKNLILDTS